jgi:hypothetical protein
MILVSVLIPKDTSGIRADAIDLAGEPRLIGRKGPRIRNVSPVPDFPPPVIAVMRRVGSF